MFTLCERTLIGHIMRNNNNIKVLQRNLKIHSKTMEKIIVFDNANAMHDFKCNEILQKKKKRTEKKDK